MNKKNTATSGKLIKAVYVSYVDVCVYVCVYIYIYIYKRFITHRVYTVCTRINYKIVPVTSLNKYLHYSTSGTE